jgi:hypothetical protein
VETQWEKEYQAGTVWAAVTVETARAGGSSRPEYLIRVQKRYFDQRDGQWKTTSYFRPDELPKLALVVAQAYEHVMLKEHDAGGGPAPGGAA